MQNMKPKLTNCKKKTKLYKNKFKFSKKKKPTLIKMINSLNKLKT